MNNTNFNEVPPLEKSYSEIFSEIGERAKNILMNDISLVTAELKQVKNHLTKESKKVVIFSALLFLSAFPILAFAIIALGRALEGNYALSSLIVGAVLSLIGAFGLYSVFKKIKKIDMEFSKTKAAFEKEKDAFYSQVIKIQHAVKGERHA